MIRTVKGHWIGGREVPSTTGESFEVRDPGTDEVLGLAARGSLPDVLTATADSNRAFAASSWKDLGGADRRRLLFRWAGLLARDEDQLARVLALENGKPLTQAHHEVAIAIRYLEYYGGWADKIGGREIPVSGDYFAYTRREPLGVVLQIIPWNYPLDILMRGVAPALAAGNAVIVKPAEDTPFIAVEVAKLAKEAGFPDGIFNVVLGFGAEAGALLTASPDIHGIAFCGSYLTGSKIVAASSVNLVPVLSLELGGKCPCLVLPDGDVEKAADAIAGGVIYNAGQSCVARTRFIVPETSLGRVKEILRARLSKVGMGHSLADPELGPIINSRQREKILESIGKAEAEGAKLEFGGRVPSASNLKEGWFLEPAVFTGVGNSMSLAREEVFGPVLPVITYKTEAEGLAIANDTAFGLAAELWTGDPGKAQGLVRRINASHITINSSGGFGVEVPFGGIGKSGFGREGGLEGLLQYTRTKSVYMAVHV